MKAVDDRQSTKPKKLGKHDVPQMPEGYYSGDKPNPNLRAFVEAHLQEKPYDPETDDYDVPAFDEPITTTKATAIYNMHTYWSKKPHDAIRQYIRHYTEEGDLVLDPFCGSGGTALAALMEGRKAIAIDRSPAATFITKNYCTPVDPDELQAAFEELKAKVKPEIDWLYETRCDRCGGKATTAYTIYSQVFQCPRCLEKVPLFDCVEMEGQTKAGKLKKITVCPHCYARGHEEEISTRSKQFGAIPVMVSYLCEGNCKPKRDERRYNDCDLKKREYFEKYDLGKIKDIKNKQIPYWYPPNKMMNVEDDSIPWGDNWRPGRNFRTVAELFTKRNLWALSILFSKIDKYPEQFRDILRFSLSSFLLNLSKLYKFRVTGGGQPTGNYYIPQINRENEAWSAFERKFSDIVNGSKVISRTINPEEVIVSTQSAVSLNSIPTNCVDFIFTDPPYAGKYQYGELNFIWEAWLGVDTHWHAEEIIVNEFLGKSEIDWADMMLQAMKESYRVLKPGRWISLCYHDTAEGTWAIVQDFMAQAGFIPDTSDSALFIDTSQKTYNQTQGDQVNRRDLVINFRKPMPGEITGTLTITGDEDSTTFSNKVTLVIREYLSTHPSSTKDRIYDEVVSCMVRLGQMEAHDFEAALRRVAEPVSGGTTNGSDRWYLKESELNIVDRSESAKEDAAAVIIGEFIRSYLDNRPDAIGVHYSDIFEHFIYAVKDKPRRNLAEWLPDYFYISEQGTYRLPVTEDEEEVKRQGRERGTNRQIKRYIALLSQSAAIPQSERPDNATLAGWLKHCRRAGLYEMGITLYERGGIALDRLSEAQQLEAEEDYLVCRKMAGRSGLQESKNRKQSTQSELV